MDGEKAKKATRSRGLDTMLQGHVEGTSEQVNCSNLICGGTKKIFIFYSYFISNVYSNM